MQNAATQIWNVSISWPREFRKASSIFGAAEQPADANWSAASSRAKNRLALALGGILDFIAWLGAPGRALRPSDRLSLCSVFARTVRFTLLNLHVYLDTMLLAWGLPPSSSAARHRKRKRKRIGSLVDSFVSSRSSTSSEPALVVDVRCSSAAVGDRPSAARVTS